MEFGTQTVARRDRVYVATSFEGALLYAALHPSGGTVYEVEPIGDVTPDPDCHEPGLSWECTRALILSRRNVSTATARRVARILLGQAVQT